MESGVKAKLANKTNEIICLSKNERCAVNRTIDRLSKKCTQYQTNNNKLAKELVRF